MEGLRAVRSREEILTNVDVSCVAWALSDTVTQFYSLIQGLEPAARILTRHGYTYKTEMGVDNWVMKYIH